MSRTTTYAPRGVATTASPRSLSLAPFSGPWTRVEARHLVARTGFGALKRDVDRALNDGSAVAAVDRLVNEASVSPLPEAPSWYSSGSSTGVNEIYDLQKSWFNDMRTAGLIEKMTLLWHNHLPTQWSINQNKTSLSVGHLMYDYYKLLRQYAVGNYRDMIRRVGLNASMHLYLDGYLNRVGQANENFARELLELFTMSQYGPGGELNYTENDIKEIARALTGWAVTQSRTTSFDPELHDGGIKTFFERSGAFEYDDVIDIIFQERTAAIAHYIAGKLYTFFVHAIPDDTVVAAIATELLASDFEIAPVLRKLLKSEHFYRPTVVGARIKSPIEYVIGFLREVEVVPTQSLWEELREILSPINLGQELLNPPNVAGWPGLNPPDASGNPGHHTWLTTSTLPDRWTVASDILYQRSGANYDPFELVSKVSDPSDPYRIAIDLATVLISVPLSETGIREISEPFAGDPSLLPSYVVNAPAHEQNLVKLLLDSTPYHEWPIIVDDSNPRVEEARSLLRAFLGYLTALPAYQLT